MTLAVSSESGSNRRDARLRGVQAKISRLEIELRDLQGREAGLLGELERLEAELRLREAELERVTLSREQLSLGIAARTRRLQTLEQEQAQRRAYLAFRLREIYKSGPDQELRRLIGGGQLERYWEGVRYAAYLSERDARVLRVYRRDLRLLEDERAGLQLERDELGRLRQQLLEAERRLQASQRQRGRRLDEIRHDQTMRRTALDELESAALELGRLIDSIEPAAADPQLDVSKFKGLLDWPCDGEVSAGYGTVVHERFKTRVPHPGLDIDGEPGASVRSVFDGRVVFASWMRGYGLTAIVDHGGGVLSIYAHAAALLVEPGETVVRDQRIGAVGNTGSLRGPYLYFELRVDGKPTDPTLWLRRRDAGG